MQVAAELVTLPQVLGAADLLARLVLAPQATRLGKVGKEM
jgi:hypothetical protein